LLEPGADHVAHDYFIDFASIHPSLAERCGDSVSAELWCVLVCQRSLKTTYWCARSAHNINI
jgi:hypothetical protein